MPRDVSGYNVQVAVDTAHHLIITHEVTNVGTDRSHLAHVSKETTATLEVESLDVVADRGYFSSEEILACDEAGIPTHAVLIKSVRFRARGLCSSTPFRVA